MYRLGEVCVCEGAASEEEKAHGPVQPAVFGGRQVEGVDLRGCGVAPEFLRGADGKLLEFAILCGVHFGQAELQGVYLSGAQLQGANLWMAQLQGANLSSAHLQGANLREANLQGARLNGAQLQGADLMGADLSVLPKGFLLPKQGPASEEEALKEDRPTVLYGANLSVLPKGSEYMTYCTATRVSDAVRPTNLTNAKATGAIFIGANLTGTVTTGASLKDAALKGAVFATHQPPERPALGALREAWRAKDLVAGVTRAKMVLADEGDDSSSDWEAEGVEGVCPDGVEAMTEKALDEFMSTFTTAAKGFLHAADGVVVKVEKLLKNSLLFAALVQRYSSGKLLITDVESKLADEKLAELLCKKLETANDKQAAISEALLKQVISPLFDHYLPEVLDEALSKQLLMQQVAQADKAATAFADFDAAAAATAASAAATAATVVVEQQLQKQLLEAFKKRALGAGKATLLKRLSPIVSKCAGVVFSTFEAPAKGWPRLRRGATVRPGKAVDERYKHRYRVSAADEEQPLMQPKDSAACLVRELWQMLRASLDAQARLQQSRSSPLLHHRRAHATFTWHYCCAQVVVHPVCR